MLVHPKPRHVLLGWRSSLWQWAGGRGVLTGAGICESADPTGTQARCKGSLQWQWSWRCSGGRGQHNQSTKTVNPASPRGWDKADIIKGSHTISFLPSSESCSKVSTQHQQGTKAGPGEAWEPACQPWARALGGFVVQCTRLLKETGVL